MSKPRRRLLGRRLGRMNRRTLTFSFHFRYSALRKSDAKSGQWVVIGTVYSVKIEMNCLTDIFRSWSGRRPGSRSPLMLITKANRIKGHLCTQIGSKGMALRIIGIDHGSKEELVKTCGAEVFLDITKYDDKTIAEEVKKVTGGLGASAVIVCTASNKAYAQALDFLRFGGTLVCVGM